MAKVRILPDRVANQIAAGEVVERPAAVVKELVENALDAGATRISVEFAHAGRSLIRVEDNGAGMGPGDARMALERHATSKIADAADLESLGTYGFRGEALPSIASVSRFTLQTRERAAADGIEITVNAGRLVHQRACGRPQGTRVDVEHLFEPVPARRKFLKSDRTESGHIVHCVRLYALARPATSFSLHEDGREVFRSPECPGLPERVAEIFGRQAAEGLATIDVAEPGLRLRGLMGLPGTGRATRQDMVCYINGRPVDSRAMNGALVESYREFLPQGRYPVAFLFLECDPAEVDVNVHPAKREVRFRREALVRGFIVRAVLTRLSELSGGLAPPALPTELGPMSALPAPFQGVREPPAASAPAASPPTPERAGPRWRFVGTAHGTYVLFETEHGVALLDRRAAHERIWYERLLLQFRAAGVPVQRLLLPVTLELSPVASAVLSDNLAFLVRHGLEVVEFGRHFYRIEALPAWMEPADADSFVRDIVDGLREGRLPAGDLDQARDVLAKMAASKAVRIGTATGEGDCAALVRDLFATTSPVSSPSGRPTFVEFNHGELARRFQK